MPKAVNICDVHLSFRRTYCFIVFRTVGFKAVFWNGRIAMLFGREGFVVDNHVIE